jgi:hypothetical protein
MPRIKRRKTLTNSQGQGGAASRDRDRWHAAFEAAQRQLPAPVQPNARVGNERGNRWQRAWRWLRTTG